MKKYSTIILTVLAFAGCQKKETAAAKTNFVLSDEMLKTTHWVTADAQPLRNEDRFYGKITADNNKTIEVYPLVGGSVTKVYVELGDYVKKGQLLATIRSTDVADFQKQLDDAQNDVLVAANNLKVAQEMFEGKLSAERDVIEAKSAYDKALSQRTRIRETYKVYSVKDGSIYEVRAPLSGFITEKNINQDMLLRNDRSDNIFDIAEINDVWAIANVNESDINNVRLGESATVTTLSYPDKIFEGKVDKIFNIIDPETKAMKVLIKLNNPGFVLKPEMSATIRLSYVERNNPMLVVPSTAVIFDKSRHFVMVYEGKDKIKTREVEVFRQVGDQSYIKAGLASGEKVLTTNQLLIYDALND